MKNKILIFSIILCIVIFVLLTFLLIKKENKNEIFSLDERYYGTNTLNEIETKDLNELIDEKKSFALFIYQPLCDTSSKFESILKKFQETTPISFYKIKFTLIKNTNLEKYIKYYPSFIIFKDGKIIDYLEADNDEDIDIYNSEEAFKTWLSNYIKLPSKKEENNVTNDTTLDTSYDINLDNVVREKNKVNIYLFWGDGCPHCKKEKEFFQSIKTKYGKYYNLYTFEVWYNEENLNILNAFASSMGEKVTGVPYTIIGSKTFKGFNDIDDYKQSIIKTIEEEKDKNYDVYFDKIKK